MSTAKIMVLVHFTLDFEEQFNHVKKRGFPLSEYIRQCVLADRKRELTESIPTTNYITTIIESAIHNKLLGFREGIVSSIMLNKLLTGVSRTEQKAALMALGYRPSFRLTNPVLPDRGCPRLYVHQDIEVTTKVELAKRYRKANQSHGVDLARLKKYIREERPGFAGGFLSLHHIGEPVTKEDAQYIMEKLGYHRHPEREGLLVQNGIHDESLERYTLVNTFIPRPLDK